MQFFIYNSTLKVRIVKSDFKPIFSLLVVIKIDFRSYLLTLIIISQKSVKWDKIMKIVNEFLLGIYKLFFILLQKSNLFNIGRLDILWNQKY